MRVLKKDFIGGKKEVSGFRFQQMYDGGNFYIYEVTDSVDKSLKHYEVFQKVYNKRYDCESYPTSKSFGLWAWTTPSYERAMRIGIERFGSDAFQRDVAICPECEI